MPDFRIASNVTLGHPLEQVFEFFSKAENLGLLTPPWLRFTIASPLPIEMKAGALIEYRIRLYGIPMKWTSEITEWDPPHMFEDTQIRGPYRKWVHRHTFEETDEGTVVTDEVRYRVPGGAVIDRLFVSGRVRKIFDYRKAKLKELFR